MSTPRSHIVAFLPAVLLLAGCPSAQTPYSFTASSESGAAVDTAARTLAAQGYEVGRADRQSGIVTSKWVAYGQADANGILVHRFTVILAPAGQGSNVTIRMDVEHCPPGGYNVGDVEVKGTCQVIDGVFPGDQKAIDALGAKLKAALTGGPS